MELYVDYKTLNYELAGGHAPASFKIPEACDADDARAGAQERWSTTNHHARD